ncbi:gamma-glutamyltransferase [Methylopila sp. M107]|uniref:gamma-glutamyltransferase family protein n=1 Tax=Methylopila sp. M107 TaxID=1101190 RepID=UPI000363BA0C|nr:gamma-glutamyltransferase [Methylopila sp. M107]
MSLTAASSRGVVAAPHSAAVETGRAILAEGGDAYEAMVGMAATVAVVYPHMNAIGGDGFWLVREPTGEVRYIEACSVAGSRATIGFYRDRGHDEIPARGPLAALTAPCAVDGWRLALEISESYGGRLPLDMLLADAVRHARAGYAVSPGQGRTVPKLAHELFEAPGFADVFLVDGKLRAAGDMFGQPKLADTLEHIGRAGLRDFFEGDVGREIAADLERIGAPVTRDDMKKREARLRPALEVRLKGASVYNSRPPTQGLVSLMILGVLERLGVKGDEDAAFIHACVEATKRAFLVRDVMCVDHDRMPQDPRDVLTPGALDRETAAVDLNRAAPYPASRTGEGDTIWMGAIDAKGRAVSYIQSIYWEYGSGCVSPSTGVLLQNRGAAFSLDPNAPNALAPGRQPFHTLNPALAVFDDGRTIVYGAMGGEGQPQTQAQIFARHAWLGLPIEEALARPRFRLGRSWGENDASLRYEPRFAGEEIDRLERMGHRVLAWGEAFDDEAGHAGMIVRRPDGGIEGGHDPRADGGAAGA